MISIVTSVYNASDTIDRTIESVLSQSFSDWELVIVNDCSTDNTLDVVKYYANLDSRIKIINHSVNMGAGCARKTGINNISGEWMTFLDSDDYLKEDCLEVLNTYANAYDVDIVSQGFIMISEKGIIMEERIPDKKIYVDGAKFKPNKQDTKRFLNPMLIKSSLWKKAVYSERRFIEDLQTLTQLLYYARNIMTINYAGYFYVQKESSLVHASTPLKLLIYQTLCAKDIMYFFKPLDIRLANPRAFLEGYNEIIISLTEEDKLFFSEELKELKDEYNKIINEQHISIHNM